MKTIESPAQAHAAIERFATQESKQDTRNCSGIKLKQWARQGDVYVHRIKEIPPGWDVEVKEHNQVALGQTAGSRHCAEGQNIKVMWPKSAEQAAKTCPVVLFRDREDLRRAAIGPCVAAPKGFHLSHPEHAHMDFPPGFYFVSYQVDLSTMRQVRD